MDAWPQLVSGMRTIESMCGSIEAMAEMVSAFDP
jgi:hypothetical protein